MSLIKRVLSKRKHAKYMREVWYPKNRQIHIQRVRELKIKLSKRLGDYKRGSSCMDCGYKGDVHPYVLDFDHKKGRETYDIGHFLKYVLSWDSLMQEIKKCDIVCANCHRIRTWARGRGVE